MLLEEMEPPMDQDTFGGQRRLPARLAVWISAVLLGVALVSFAASRFALRQDTFRLLDGDAPRWSTAPGVPSGEQILWERLSLLAIVLTLACYLGATFKYHLSKKR